MNKMSWTHEELQQQFGNTASLNNIISKLDELSKGKNLFITRISVNGMNFSEIDEARYSTTTLDEISSISVEACRLEDMLCETIESSIALSDNLHNVAIVAADHLRAGELVEAHRAFKLLMTEIENLFVAYQLAFEVLRDRGHQLKTGPSSYLSQFNIILNSLLSSYEKRDFILTADQLEYDLTKALKDFSSNLKGVGQFAEGLGPQENSVGR